MNPLKDAFPFEHGDIPAGYVRIMLGYQRLNIYNSTHPPARSP